jgi:hypothetical protein
MFRNLLIIVALFGLGLGASFGAGAAWARRTAPPAVQAAQVGGAASAAQLPSGAAGAAGLTGGAGGGAGQGAPGAQGLVLRGATAGTVSRVEGSTVVVDGPNNQQVRVNVGSQTQVVKQQPGSVADLAAGARVNVVPQGQPAADGSMTAAVIQIVPEGAAGSLQGGAQQGQRPAGQGGPGGQGQQGGQGQR